MRLAALLPTRRSPAAASLCALTLTAGLAGPAPPAAAADDPPFVGWTAVMPALAFDYSASSSNDCVAGRLSCVKATIKQMRSRFRPLARSCDHGAVFSLAYLRTTEAYLEATTTDGFFREPRLVNHEDVAFARMYFHAQDAWRAGRVERVPPAWRVAFAAADRRQVSGTGDLMLGINAHVQRDLPFVLFATGLVGPDGVSRKGDHDQINVMLNRVGRPLLAEEAARFDPTMEQMETPYGIGYTGLMQTLLAWRELAWRHAERLAAAPDAAARRLVAREIESHARASALAIVASAEYRPPVTTTDARDAYCARHGTVR